MVDFEDLFVFFGNDWTAPCWIWNISFPVFSWDWSDCVVDQAEYFHQIEFGWILVPGASITIASLQSIWNPDGMLWCAKVYREHVKITTKSVCGELTMLKIANIDLHCKWVVAKPVVHGRKQKLLFELSSPPSTRRHKPFVQSRPLVTPRDQSPLGARPGAKMASD